MKFDARVHWFTFPARFRKISTTKMVDGSVICEAAFLNFNAEFERNGFGKTPEGLQNLLRTAVRKPGETAEKMRHRIYSRLYGIMWHGCKIGRGQFTGGQPTFVFPKCVKDVVRAIVKKDVRDFEDPFGPHVYHVTLKDLVDAKWPAAKKEKKNKKK